MEISAPWLGGAIVGLRRRIRTGGFVQQAGALVLPTMKPEIDGRKNPGEVLVRVEGVSKRFSRSLRKSLWYGLQDILTDLTGRGARDALRPDEFWAVNDVSFELRRGECLGLIGHNGAGKTSILRMLNGLIRPDRGRIELRGRVGGLIALGAGFNPILTGRENIYVNASVLGINAKETDKKVDEIVDFAEVSDFIDTPVQSYSSGMYVRLGFAIAAVLVQPDVLLLDEILAVGDVSFTIKCLNAAKRMSKDSAVIFVSHNMQFVSSFCTRVMVMDHGQCLVDASAPWEGIDYYCSMFPHRRQESGIGGAKVKTVHLKVDGSLLFETELKLAQGTPGSAMVDLEVQSPGGAHLNVFIHDQARNPVISLPVLNEDGSAMRLGPGKFQVEIPLGPLELNAGIHSFVLTLRDAETALVLTRVEGACPFRVTAQQYHWGKIVRPTVALVTNRH
jgi:lipopolysaccharide transport system ATP-binding protein